MSASVVTGEKAKMIHAHGKTVTEAMEVLGPLIDKYIENDWILQGINVYAEHEHVYLLATVSRWKS